MRTRTIAIAGLGAAAVQIHLPACAKLAALTVVGGSDPAVGDRRFPFPLYPSVEEMLAKSKPDILAVATPPESHYALARLGLLSGCHVFCEKPFTSTLDEAADLVKLSEQVGRWIVVNNQYRFMNIHEEAKRRIGSSEFGELLFLTAHQTFFVTEETEDGWRGRDLRRTCKEFGTHVLDLCRFFFDEDPVALTCRMPRPGHREGPDYLNLIQLEFSRDRIAHVTLDRLCRGPTRYLNVRLDGSAGCIETQLGGKIELRMGIAGGTRRPYVNFEATMGGRAALYHGPKARKIAADPLDLFAHATSRLLEAFLDALDQDREPPCSARDNRRTLALMLAAYESAEKGVTVRFDESLRANGLVPSEGRVP